MPNPRSRSSPFKRGGAAILDQGFASGATFLTSVAVAWRLPLQEHGRFGFAMALLGLLHQLHAASLVEPALMHAKGQFQQQGEIYRSAVWRMHRWLVLALVPIMAVLVTGAAWLDPETVPSLAVLAVATPGLLSLHLARRLEVAWLRPERAAQRSGGFALLTVVGLVVCDRLDRLSSEAALATMGVAATLVLLVDLRRVRPTHSLGPGFATMVAAHRDHAGWGLGAAAAAWVPRHGVYVLLPMVAADQGFVVAGILRTHMLVILPVMLAVAALANLSTSVFAERRAAGAALGLPSRVVQAGGFAGIYGSATVLFAPWLMAHAGVPSELWWRVLAAIAGTAYAAGAMVAAALLARAASKALFLSSAGGALLLAAAAYPVLNAELTVGSFAMVAGGYLANLVLFSVALARLKD